MKISKRALPFYIITITYAGYIFYLSSKESLRSSGVEVTGFDKANHVIEYSVLGFFLMFSLYFTPYVIYFLRRVVPEKWKQDVMMSWVMGSLYGVSDEIHQHFVPGRTMDILDMAADSLGVLLGITGALVILFISMDILRGRK